MNRWQRCITKILRLLDEKSAKGRDAEKHESHSGDLSAQLAALQAFIEQIEANSHAEQRLKNEQIQIERKRLGIERWTLSLVVLGAFAACLNLWLLGDSVDAARDAAKAAINAVESDRLSQRAYLTVPGLVTRAFVDGDGNVVAVGLAPRWENSGATPTKTATAYSNWEARPTEMDAAFDFSDRNSGSERVPLRILAPNTGTNMQSMRVKMAVADLINQERLFLYLWGWSLYEDVFPETRPHYTRYCVRVTRIQRVPQLALKPSNQFEVNWTQCPAGNCIDENCPDYEKRIKSEALGQSKDQP